MKVIFAIPTWNRAQQLAITLEKLSHEITRSGYEGLILVSDNCSTDETFSSLEQLQMKHKHLKVQRLKEHQDSRFNFTYVLHEALSIAKKEDYIWFFGDDDDISADSFRIVFEVLENSKPIFCSVGNSRLWPHTNKAYTLNAADLVQNLSFFLTLGFMSQCIFSYNLLSDILRQNLFSTVFANDAYAHGSSVLFLCHDRPVMYIDLPICTYREYPNQEEETRTRWGSENIYDNIFNFIDTVSKFQELGILPKRIQTEFFRYWRWHFWDFLMYEATVSGLAVPDSINGKHWDLIYKLCGMLKDVHIAKQIKISTDLQRLLLISGAKKEDIFSIAQQYPGLRVYKNSLIESDGLDMGVNYIF